MTMQLPDATRVRTAPLTALGLVGGWQLARRTGNRPLGGVVLAAAGVAAGRSWYARGGAGRAALLSALYVLGFGASHPLAKRLGPWPSVLAVTAANAVADHVVHDSELH